MATLNFVRPILILLPPIACLVVILLLLRKQEKSNLEKNSLFVMVSLIISTLSSLLWPIGNVSDAPKVSINTYTPLLPIFILGWILWKTWKEFLDLGDQTQKYQVRRVIFCYLLLLIGAGLFFISSFIPPMQDYVTFQSLNILDLSILVVCIIFAFSFLRTHSPEFFNIALSDIFHNLKAAVFVLDPQFRIIQSNATAQGIFHSIQPGDEIIKYIGQLGSTLDKVQNNPSNISEFEINIKGFMYWGKIIPIQSQNHLLGWNIILSDVTKLKHTQEQLAHYALHDRLTDLPNRVILMDRLNHAMLSARRDEDYKYAVLYLDLDRFKAINENLGHEAGDQVLVEIANRLKLCLRKVDTATCLGADEFVILLDKISGVRAASEVSVRVLELLSQKIIFEENEIHPSVSIGISMGSPRHQKPEDILSEADTALQEAKDRGKGQYVIFDKEMHAHVSTRYQIESDLHHALQDNQFELYYQPILTLPGQGILGFEALLRWNHPEHGLMLPCEFLLEANEPELILPIGYWEIEKACQEMARWSSKFPFEPPLSLSINLFRKQLIDPELPKVLQSILQETKVPSQCLTLEIKEKVIVDDDPTILDAIKNLKSIGVRLSIDDFGTGYSSLRVLPTYPIDAIKIAPTFIRNICRSSEDYEVARFMVELGHRLSIEVIAQGIESPHEMIEIQSLNCQQGQGAYLSKPLVREDVDKLLDKISQMKIVDQRIDPKKIL